MIRARDRVLVTQGTGELVTVVEAVNAGRVLVRAGSAVLAFDDGDVELLCSKGCTAIASRFLRDSGDALCDACASNHGIASLLDTRPGNAIVTCSCGESLDDGKSKGIWTLEGIAVEYRDCVHCGSTRAYMPAPIVKGRLVALYKYPATSEVAEEWHDLLDALESHPFAGAELRRNGIVLARVVEGPRGARAWHVQKPSRETPVAV